MDALLSATMAEHGFMPPVVPEFPGITVGGAFAGTAGESSSWRWGFFDGAVKGVEMVLGDGEVVWAREGKAEREDLLRGAAGTFGTLGVATLFEIRLVKARSFVKLMYVPVTSIRDAGRVIGAVISDQDARRSDGNTDAGDSGEEDSNGPGRVDFLDGIMYSPTSGVIILGSLTDQKHDVGGNPFEIVTFHKPWDEWFYLHAEKRMQNSSHLSSPSPSSSSTLSSQKSQYSSLLASQYHIDLVPLPSYIFRYDRGAFWTGLWAYKYFITPFNRVTRTLLDPFMHTRTMYHALHRSGLIRDYIVQDMAVPMELDTKASSTPPRSKQNCSNISDGGNGEGEKSEGAPEKFTRWLDENVPGIYPRWLCPLRVKAGSGISTNPHWQNDSRNIPSTHDQDLYKTAKPKGQEKDRYLLNIGLWGPIPPIPPNPTPLSSSSASTSSLSEKLTWSQWRIQINRAIESHLSSLGGMKWLYAQTFYTESEFWSIYDRQAYDALRVKYKAVISPAQHSRGEEREGGGDSGDNGTDSNRGGKTKDDSDEKKKKKKGKYVGLPDIWEKVGGKDTMGSSPTMIEDQTNTTTEPRINTITTIKTTDDKSGVFNFVWQIWPLRGIYGVLSVIKGGDYLRKSR